MLSLNYFDDFQFISSFFSNLTGLAEQLIVFSIDPHLLFLGDVQGFPFTFFFSSFTLKGFLQALDQEEKKKRQRQCKVFHRDNYNSTFISHRDINVERQHYSAYRGSCERRKVDCSGCFVLTRYHAAFTKELFLPLEKEIGRWSHLTYNSALNLKLVWTF